jgi:arylsulfatase A-like enzyme
LTGRYAIRLGIGWPIGDRKQQWDLQDDEVTIPEVLAHRPEKVATFAVGKWHLDGPTPERADGARRQGFGSFAGLESNLDEGESYTSYAMFENGVARHGTKYLTIQQVDDTLKAISAAREPWFGYLASPSRRRTGPGTRRPKSWRSRPTTAKRRATARSWSRWTRRSDA